MNLAIVIARRTSRQGVSEILTTGYNRWPEAFRPHLFNTLSFFPSYLDTEASSIPKLGSQTGAQVLEKIQGNQSLARLRSTSSDAESIYYHSGGRYFRKCLTEKLSNEYKELKVPRSWKPAMIGLLSSNTYYWHWIALSDCYHVTKRDIDSLGVPEQLEDDRRIWNLADRLLRDLWDKAEIRNRTRADGSVQREVNFQVGKSMSVIHDIDTLLASHYGFTDEEFDFVVNFDAKYRLGSWLAPRHRTLC